MQGRGRCVAERQAHVVAAAVVERAAALDAAAAVGGDAADGVLGGVAGEGDAADGDAVARRDRGRSLALLGAERAGVVAVGQGGAVTGEGAARIVASASHYLGLAVGEGGGGVE